MGRKIEKKLEQKKLNQITHEIFVPSTSVNDTASGSFKNNDCNTFNNFFNFNDNEEAQINGDITISNSHDHNHDILDNFESINFSIRHDHCYFTPNNNNSISIIESNIQNSTTINNLKTIIHHDHCYNISENIEILNTPNTRDVCGNYEAEIIENFIGDMNIDCIHCQAKHFPSERVSNKGDTFNDCCNHGNAELSPAPEFPVELKKLFISEHQLSNQFFQNIRLYNNLFSFASFNANLINFSGRWPGPYCFKIQGQIYYQINTALHPEINEKPSYGQLFILGANEAIEHRMTAFNADVHVDIVEMLENIMRQYNIFAQSYEMMGDEIRKQEMSESHQELQLLFSLKSGEHDKRRYNF